MSFRRLLAVLFTAALPLCGVAYVVDGVDWTIGSANNKVTITAATMEDDSELSGAIAMPAAFGDSGQYKTVAFQDNVFRGCTKITSVKLPEGIKEIGEAAFAGCTSLRKIEIPSSVTNVGYSAFSQCENLATIIFKGDTAPQFDENIFGGVPPENCTIYVPDGATGWGVEIPGEWNGVKIAYMSQYFESEGTPIFEILGEKLVSVDLNGAKEVEIPEGVTIISAGAFAGCEMVERVIIPNGVTNIPFSAFSGCDRLWANWYKTLAAGGKNTGPVSNVIPSSDGFVNIIAEVASSAPLAIPSSWADKYSGFAEKFGGDFAAALLKPSGKRDAAGKAMQVWQDFVAGTDPTDESDVFRAGINFDDDGNPVIFVLPKLSDDESEKRIYRKFGKVRINDRDWTEIQDGEESGYNFFRVTVEMK